MPRPRAVLPAPLSQAALRFDRWRGERTTRRIPEALWALAAELGARHGVSRTARALRVPYAALKRHVEARAGSPPMPASSFVEIHPVAPPTVASCRLELERTSGEVMRVFLPETSEQALVALARVFLGGHR